MNLRDQTRNVAGQGRYGDTMLMHVNPAEVEAISRHVPLTINPDTGQPEAFLPMLLGMGLPALAGSSALAGTAIAGMSPHLLAGLGAGLGSFIETGDPGAALMSGVTGGLGSYGMGYMMGGAPGAAGGAAPTAAPAPLAKPNIPPGLDPAFAAQFAPPAPMAPAAAPPMQPPGGMSPVNAVKDLPFDINLLNMPSNVSPAELQALAMTESSMNPAAVSPAGAQGLTQIMPDTAAQPGYGVNPLPKDKIFDPVANSQFGVDYLSAMKNQYPDTSSALAAYNRGPGNVNKALASGKSFANDPYVQTFNSYLPQPAGPGSPQGPGTPPGAGLDSPMVPPGPQDSLFAPMSMDIMPPEKPGGIMDTLADNWLPITAGVAGLGMLMGPEEEEEKKRGSNPKRYQSSRTYTPRGASLTGVENEYFSPMSFKPVGFGEGGSVFGGLMNLGGGAMGGLIPAMVNRDLPLNPIDYFMNFHNKKKEEEEKGFPKGLKALAGRPQGFQQGGPVGGDDNRIIHEAVSAIQGSHPDSENAIRRFIQRFGMDAFEELIQDVEELGEQGDTVPAMLEPGEFVMTKDAVDGMGGGNNGLGAERLDQMMAMAEGAA